MKNLESLCARERDKFHVCPGRITRQPFQHNPPDFSLSRQHPRVYIYSYYLIRLKIHTSLWVKYKRRLTARSGRLEHKLSDRLGQATNFNFSNKTKTMCKFMFGKAGASSGEGNAHWHRGPCWIYDLPSSNALRNSLGRRGRQSV